MMCTHFNRQKIVFGPQIRNDLGIECFRIPVITQTSKKTLLAFAEGRFYSSGDSDHIGTWMRRSEDFGETWGKPIKVWDDSVATQGNPCPIIDGDRIHLLLTFNEAESKEEDILRGEAPPRLPFYTFSDDDGLTWRKPRLLSGARKETWGWYATGPAKGLKLSKGPRKGRLIAPCNHSDLTSFDPHHPYKCYESHILYSDDGGNTWMRGPSMQPFSNESTIAELSDGSLLYLMRHEDLEIRFASISLDGGDSWENLPFPTFSDGSSPQICQGSLVRHKKTLYFSIPTGPERTNLTIYSLHESMVKTDTSWKLEKVVHMGCGGYSSLVLCNSTLSILYERDTYRKLVYWFNVLEEPGFLHWLCSFSGETRLCDEEASKALTTTLGLWTDDDREWGDSFVTLKSDDFGKEIFLLYRTKKGFRGVKVDEDLMTLRSIEEKKHVEFTPQIL